MAAMPFTSIDWSVLVLYFVCILGMGFYFWKRNDSADQFTSAGQSLPGWLCGLSIFATYLSSISYLALPGKAYVDNWNPFVFSLAIPIAAWIATRSFLPLYRNSSEVSAYSLLENRFGLWARLFASSFYLLYQIARMGVVMYLMALPMAILFGWDIRVLILITGVIVTLYSFIGGIVAVIWADAIQAVILTLGAIFALVLILIGLPEGPNQVVEVAMNENKFSLGEMTILDYSSATFWVVLLFGLFENLKNFGIDQSYVQRYIASSSHREAARGLWLGAILYIPVSALFFFIGTSLFVYYQAYPNEQNDVRQIVASQRLMQQGVTEDQADYLSQREKIAARLEQKELGDRVFPHFIANHMPTGLRGLLIAAVFAAAMSTVSTSLNSSATLVMTDFYRRLVNPNSSDRQQMFVLQVSTVIWGAMGTGMALVMVKLTDNALDIWWTLSGVLGAVVIGLFLMGILNPNLGSQAAKVVMIVGLILIGWMTFSQTDYWPESLESFISPFHKYLVVVFGPIVMILLGRAMSRKQVES